MSMKRLSIAALMLTALTGCTVTPGVYMSTSGKNVVDTGDRDISKFVDIYPISPKLLGKVRTSP
ncbi:hypothetical protein SND13_12185 [Escherichia coli]|nr:hypothetical protein [Escherichia coli]